MDPKFYVFRRKEKEYLARESETRKWTFAATQENFILTKLVQFMINDI